MIENNEQADKEVGEYLLDANNFIDRFTQTQNGAFTLKIDFNDDWAADIELYVQKSRYGVQRLIRQIKNPKQTRQNQAPPPSHQRITEQRKKLDLQTKDQDQLPNHHNFKKFSPKRESQDEIQKKNQFFNRKIEQPPKKQIATTITSTISTPKKEEKKIPKGQFVPKKQWMIPQAEKYIANTKTNTKSNQKSAIAKNAKIGEQKPSSSVKSEKDKSKGQQQQAKQPSFLEKLPIQPKYVILFAILLALVFAASVFLKSEAPQKLPLPLPKQPKTKKQSEKPQKSSKVKK